MPDTAPFPIRASAPADGAPALDDCWRRIGVVGDASCVQLASHIHCRNCPTYSRAAVQLLDALAIDDDGDDEPGAAPLARPDTATAGERGAERSCLVFRVGDEWLALPTAELGEVTAPCAVHSLPHRRHAAMLGVASVRGSLLACVSLALLFGGEEPVVPGERRVAQGAQGAQGADGVQRGRFLILGQGRTALALPVAEVSGVRRVGPDALLPLPATLSRASSRYTTALFAHEGRSVGLLDATLLRQVLSRSLV